MGPRSGIVLLIVKPATGLLKVSRRAIQRWNVVERLPRLKTPNAGDIAPLPEGWGRTLTDEPMPPVAAAVRRSREEHCLLRLLFRTPTMLYRIRMGWLLGDRFLLLTHTGRKTGKTLCAIAFRPTRPSDAGRPRSAA
jgi:hypothetical protein